MRDLTFVLLMLAIVFFIFLSGCAEVQLFPQDPTDHRVSPMEYSVILTKPTIYET